MWGFRWFRWVVCWLFCIRIDVDSWRIVSIGSCHEPRYWSAMDWYKDTLLQEKQVQDVSLWFPYRFRAGWTTEKFPQSLFSSSPGVWEQVQTGMGKLYHNWMIRWSYYLGKVVWLSGELISTLKNHMQVIVILLMQSGTTFAWINQPLWCHYDTIRKWCHPVLYSHWLIIVDYAKQVHTCKRYIYWTNKIDSPSDCPFVTSPPALPQ